MEYNHLFDKVRRHLNSLGVVCTVETNKVAADRALRMAEDTIKVRLPAELREFYQTVSDGFSLRWQADPDDDEAPFANLEIPTLDYLADMYTGWRKLVLYSPDEAKKYGFPFTDDPALAQQTASRMWHWLPVIEEGNGDMFCLE